MLLKKTEVEISMADQEDFTKEICQQICSQVTQKLAQKNNEQFNIGTPISYYPNIDAHVNPSSASLTSVKLVHKSGSSVEVDFGFRDI